MIAQSANAVVAKLKSGEITPHDCLDALEARIAIVEPKVNALPILCFDRARAKPGKRWYRSPHKSLAERNSS